MHQPSMKNGDYGIIGPGLLIIGVIAVVGFWPAMVWHGQTDTGGWRWNIDSTIGCCVWWSFTVLPLVIAAIVDVHRKRKAIMAQYTAQEALARAEQLAAEAEKVPEHPACQHLDAIRVESSLDRNKTLAYWCPDCEAQLGEDFGRLMRPCCGTPAGTDHWRTCPQWRGDPSSTDR